MNIIQDEIIRIARLSMNDFMRKFTAVYCQHVWEKHSVGFMCGKCMFYTGTNSVLNESISAEKGQVKP